MSWIWCITLICMSLAVMPTVAQSGDAGFVQTGLDAIFAVDSANHRITAMYSVGYTDAPETVHWLFPILPNARRVELGSALLTTFLDWDTRPNIEPPGPDCDLSPTLECI